jgi:uncharacterized protein YjgD (DUF1641 family)
MAAPIQFEVRPARTEMTAREELDRLLETCHRHGLLRLANDLIAANKEVAQILVSGLEKPGTLNVIQNLSVLLMALSCIPPAELYRLVFAAADGTARLAASSRDGPQQNSQDGTRPRMRMEDPTRPPGVLGVYRLLHDEQLWRALAPLIEGLKGFAEGLEKPVSNPISDFSGKPGRPS